MHPHAPQPLAVAEALEQAYRLAMDLESLAQARVAQSGDTDQPGDEALCSLSSALLDVIDRSRAALVCACAGPVR